MRRQLEAVVEELKAWRASGRQGVYLADATLKELSAAIGRTARVPVDQTPADSTGEAPADKQAVVFEPSAPEMIDIAAIAADPKPKTKRAKKAAAVDPAVAQGLPAGCEPIPAPTSFELPDGDKTTQWTWLRDKVLADPVCNAHLRPGDKVVFGVGNIDAEIVFCGEAPGEQEAKQGEPFVGPAGQLLDKIIGAMGLSRADVYISNICNWRPEHNSPTGNRKPVPAEMAYCLPFLIGQLSIVQPKLIVALGKTAVEGLLGTAAPKSITRARGNWADFHGTPVMLTFHPSYLLHNDSRQTKRELWEDMLKVMERLEMPISEKQRGYFA